MKIQGENEYKYFNILLLQNFFLHFYVEVYSSEQMFLIVSSSTIQGQFCLWFLVLSLYMHLFFVSQDLAHAVLARDTQLVKQLLQKKCPFNVNLKNMVINLS